MSIPGTVMGLTCSTVALVFCQMNGLGDCVTSCLMFIGSCSLSLLVYSFLYSQMTTLALIILLQFILGYAVQNVLSAQVTNIMMICMNTLASILMPLDQLDKLLATRDLSYVSYLMNSLNAVSCILWGMYYQLAGAPQLAVPNIAGLICSILLVPACLYGQKTWEKGHFMVKIAEISVNVLYRMPKKIVSGGVKEKEEDQITSKGKKVESKS